MRPVCFILAVFSAACTEGPPLTVEHLDDYRGQPALRIAGPSVTWVFHKQGAALASLLDRDGNDWISYRPEGGASGHYRGFPNLIHPENDFHPGGRNSDLEILDQSDRRVRLRAVTRDGQWEAFWDLAPNHVRLTVAKAPRPYWVLYEGTPGGALDLDHSYYLRADSPPTPVTEPFAADLPGPEWIAFGDDRLDRVLYLVQHHDDDKLDQFYEMNSAMTVFGFGREHRCCGKYLSQVPATYTLGLAESADPAAIRRAIDQVLEESSPVSR